jgi:hypothetical protein
LGFSAGTKKVVARTDHHIPSSFGRIDRIDRRIRIGAIYLHAVLVDAFMQRKQQFTREPTGDVILNLRICVNLENQTG